MRPNLAFSKNLTGSSCLADSLTIELPIGIAEPSRRRWRGDATFASSLSGFCDYELMTRLSRFLMPLVAGFIVTILQIVMTVALLAPEKPIAERYSTLVQHDSYWFMRVNDVANFANRWLEHAVR